MVYRRQLPLSLEDMQKLSALTQNLTADEISRLPLSFSLILFRQPKRKPGATSSTLIGRLDSTCLMQYIVLSCSLNSLFLVIIKQTRSHGATLWCKYFAVAQLPFHTPTILSFVATCYALFIDQWRLKILSYQRTNSSP